MSIKSDLETALYCYAHGFDANDVELMAAPFADNVTMTGFGQPVSGRDALVALSMSARAQMEGQPRHMITNVLVDSATGTEVHSRAYFMFSVAVAGSLQILTTGVYRDRWSNLDGRWLIVERNVENDTHV